MSWCRPSEGAYWLDPPYPEGTARVYLNLMFFVVVKLGDCPAGQTLSVWYDDVVFRER